MCSIKALMQVIYYVWPYCHLLCSHPTIHDVYIEFLHSYAASFTGNIFVSVFTTAFCCIIHCHSTMYPVKR